MSQQFGLWDKGAFRDALSLVGGQNNNTLGPRKWEALWVNEFKTLYDSSAAARHLTHHTFVTEFTKHSALSGLWNWFNDGELRQTCQMKVPRCANQAVCFCLFASLNKL